MEGIFKVLERTLSLIVTVQQACDNQRRQLELVCQDYKSLLCKWDASKRKPNILLQRDSTEQKECKHSKEAEDIILAMNMLEKAKKVKEKYLQTEKQRKTPAVLLGSSDKNANEIRKTLCLGDKTEAALQEKLQSSLKTAEEKKINLMDPLKKNSLRNSLSLEKHCKPIPSLKCLSHVKYIKENGTSSRKTVKSAPPLLYRERSFSGQSSTIRKLRKGSDEEAINKYSIQAGVISRTELGHMKSLHLGTLLQSGDSLSLNEGIGSLLAQKQGTRSRFSRNPTIFHGVKTEANLEISNSIHFDSIQQLGQSPEMFDKLKMTVNKHAQLIGKARVLASRQNKNAADFIEKLNSDHLIDTNANKWLMQNDERCSKIRDSHSILINKNAIDDNTEFKVNRLQSLHNNTSIWMWYSSSKLHNVLPQMPEVVYYKSAKELQDLFTLLHEIQEIHLLLDIIKMLNEALPYFLKLDTSNRNFVSIYHCLYSILCEEGKKSAVLIQNK